VSTFRVFQQILALGRAEWWRLAPSAVFLFIYQVAGALSLALLIPFLEILFSATTSAGPTVGGNPTGWELKARVYTYLSDQVRHHGTYSVLLGVCGVIAASILVKNVFRYLAALQIAPFEQRIITELRNRLFERQLRFPVSHYTRTPKGQALNRLTLDVQYIQEGVVGTLMNLVSDPLTMLLFFGAMAFISWELTVFTLVVLPLTGLVLSRIRKSLRKRAHRGQDLTDGLVALADETLGNIRVVKAFGSEAWFSNRYAAQNEALYRTMVGFKRRVDLASPVNEVLSVWVVLGVILYGGMLILSGNHALKPSEFIGFVALFSQFIAPLKTLSAAAARVQKAVVSFERIRQILDTPLVATETPGGQAPSPLKSGVEFRNVRFRHADGDRDAVRNVSFVLPQGQRVALVGPSGAGKTTIADLLCRFQDPTEGQILWDGQDIRALDPIAYRRQLGVVGQDPVLFHDTLRANIALGDPTPDPERLDWAVRAAHAAGFIQELPEGLNTRVGERGTRLSGGQRQRIAIARALYHNPQVLVLDEATSALDTESERLVHAALERLVEGRTALVIAHRLSTVQNADLILVFQHGEIVERGTHAGLIARGGLYAQLYQQLA
jgi:subfamily B ATP-binding cassette protein MsbA